MAIVLNPANNGTVVDRTDSLLRVPNTVGVTNALGLFTNDPRSQKTIEITRKTRKNSLLEDRNWDERNQTIAGRESDSLILKIPHFPADDAITPNDIDGVVQAGSLGEFAELETVASVRADKMIDLREAHGLTLEAARMQLIVDGTAYAPRGTVSTNFYTEFGITQPEESIDLAAASDPRSDVNAAKKLVRAGLTGGSAGQVRSFVALCSESFFNALIMNAYVTDALKSVNQDQALSILLGSNSPVNGLDARFESVTMFGVTWINVGAAGYDNADGDFVPFMPEGEARLLPAGVRDMFRTYYSPANRFSHVNRRAEMSYWWEYMNEKDDMIEIMTEQNFLNALLQPAAVVKLSLT